MKTEPPLRLIDLARGELLRSNSERGHPFRIFWLSTQGDFPEVRTVVSRGISPDFDLRFYTDTRSPKVSQILAEARVSALFYDSEQMLQIRLRGMASLLDPDSPTYQELLRQVQEQSSLKDYSSANAPGSPLGENAQDEASSGIHFSVVVVRALELDILKLGKDSHQRAHYARRGEDWGETLLVP